MGRNSSGTYILPSPGVPFQSGTTISSSQVNATLSDLATEVGSSLDRAGRGGALAPIRGVDGTVAAPAVSFTAEPASGLYRAGANDVRLAVGGVDFITPNGISFPGAGGFGPVLTSTVSGKSVAVVGNQTAASGAADVQIGCTAIRTAGFIAAFQNPINTGNKLLIDFNGLLTLANQAASLQPSSLLTSLTVGANWAINGNLAFWKDATGTVHLQGGATPAAGAVGTIFTIPAGFRPRADATSRFVVSVGSGSATNTVVIDGTTGACSALGAVTTGASIAFDSITFLAGQ